MDKNNYTIFCKDRFTRIEDDFKNEFEKIENDFKNEFERIEKKLWDNFVTIEEKVKVEFEKIESDNNTSHKEMHHLYKQVNNELTKLSVLEKQYRKLMFFGILPLLVMLLSGIGFWLYSFGRMEARLNVHLEQHIKQTQQIVIDKDINNVR